MRLRKYARPQWPQRFKQFHGKRIGFFRVEDVVAEGVDLLPLFIHHIVIFEGVLADRVIALFDPFLGCLDRFIEDRWRKSAPLPEGGIAARSAVMRGEAKRRMSESSKETKNLEEPGSPWRAQRPRSCLSMRRDWWRVVPMTWRPPESATPSSSLMSVPRPAMLVATVMAPRRPASAMISASLSWFLALKTVCSSLFCLEDAGEFFRDFDRFCSDQDGPSLCHGSRWISLRIALYFSRSVM